MLSDNVLAKVNIDAVVRRHRRNVQRRKLLADVEDHIGELHVWPRKEQQLVLSGRPTGRNDTYRFILFVLGNGGPARPLAAMLVGLGLLPNAKKRCDAWDVLRSFRDGTLRPDAFYWRLETNARQQVHAVDSWCAHGVPASMRDPLFWIDAQRMLKS